MAKTSASTSGKTTPPADDKTVAEDTSDSTPRTADTASAAAETPDSAANTSGVSTDTDTLTNPAELPVTTGKDDKKKRTDAPAVDDYPDTYIDDMKVELDAETADVLTRLYLQRRIEYQASYYEQRAIEYESNSDLAFRAGAILMTLSSLLASIGVVSSLPIFAMLTALIPAMASFVATFRQLYQWDRQMALYRDTLLGLERARILMPDPDIITPEDAKRVLPQLVKETEGVLEKEVAQWGQIARGSGDDDDSAQATFKENFEAAMVQSDGSFDQDKFNRVSGILTAADNVPDSDALARLKPENVLDGKSTLLAADSSAEPATDASDTHTASANNNGDSTDPTPESTSVG